KIRSATTNEIKPQAAIIPIWLNTALTPAPSSITARTASISAVSGNILIVGCTTSGNRAAEKNTPDVTSIGSVVRFTNPATVCVFWARDPIHNPIPANIKEPSVAKPTINSIEPRIGTLNTQ